MLHILLVSTRSEALHSFAQTLSSDPEVQFRQAAGRAEAIDMVSEFSPRLVVVDTGLPDTDSLELVRELLGVNAMVNTAVVSPLTDEQFHEASEGLGVLCRLPLDPGKVDAQDLLEKLRKIL